MSHTFAEHMVRFHPQSETARLFRRVQELEAATGALDELVAAYPKEGKWDDALSVWAYGRGFEAGLHHARLETTKKTQVESAKVSER